MPRRLGDDFVQPCAKNAGVSWPPLTGFRCRSPSCIGPDNEKCWRSAWSALCLSPVASMIIVPYLFYIAICI